ncbi:MAG: alpha/beta hydrolase family protein [Bacillus sp. (in: firmicutes)]
MNLVDGTIVERTPFPSPHPTINLYTVTYVADGLQIKGLLAEPQGEERLDGFLYLRGGINNVGQVRPGRIIQFAAEGFIVFAPFYRGNQGGEGYDDFVGDNRRDAYAAYTLLANLPRVNQVHVFGFSRGGLMALWTAITCPTVASVVTWGGVSDAAFMYKERLDLRRMLKRVVGGSPTKYPERYVARTPLHQIEKIKCPILIIHGAQDENVSILHSKKLEVKLLQHKKDVESWYFREYTHFFPPSINRRTVENLSNWMKTRR